MPRACAACFELYMTGCIIGSGVHFVINIFLFPLVPNEIDCVPARHFGVGVFSWDLWRVNSNERMPTVISAG